RHKILTRPGSRERTIGGASRTYLGRFHAFGRRRAPRPPVRPRRPGGKNRPEILRPRPRRSRRRNGRPELLRVRAAIRGAPARPPPLRGSGPRLREALPVARRLLRRTVRHVRGRALPRGEPEEGHL